MRRAARLSSLGMESAAQTAAILSPADAMVSVIAFAFGLAIFGAGVELLRRMLELRRAFRPAAATVVSVRSTSMAPLHPDRHVYEVVIEYRTDNGVARRMTSSGMQRFDVGFVPGQRLTVLYDPGQPERAVIKTASAWVNPLFLIAIGLILAAIWLTPLLA